MAPTQKPEEPLGLFRKCCGLVGCLSLCPPNRRGAACCARLRVRVLVGQGKPFDLAQDRPCPYDEGNPVHVPRHDPTRRQQNRRILG